MPGPGPGHGPRAHVLFSDAPVLGKGHRKKKKTEANNNTKTTFSIDLFKAV